MRRVPVYAGTADWPRKAAEGINGLQNTAEVQEERLSVVEARFDSLGDYADDTAAASGGVPVGGLYRNGSVVQIRVA